jgi:hypothetical protein
MLLEITWLVIVLLIALITLPLAIKAVGHLISIFKPSRAAIGTMEF